MLQKSETPLSLTFTASFPSDQRNSPLPVGEGVESRSLVPDPAPPPFLVDVNGMSEARVSSCMFE